MGIDIRCDGEDCERILGGGRIVFCVHCMGKAKLEHTRVQAELLGSLHRNTELQARVQELEAAKE